MFSVKLCRAQAALGLYDSRGVHLPQWLSCDSTGVPAVLGEAVVPLSLLVLGKAEPLAHPWKPQHWACHPCPEPAAGPQLGP